MRSVSGVVDPNGEYRKVVRARRKLLENVVTEATLIIAALFGQGFEQDFGLVLTWRWNINMRDHVQRIGSACGRGLMDCELGMNPSVKRAIVDGV
jgi:hypothetical protein